MAEGGCAGMLVCMEKGAEWSSSGIDVGSGAIFGVY